MLKHVKRVLLRCMNAVIGLSGREIVWRGQKDHAMDFLPFKETQAAAKQERLSVADYVDMKHSKPGASQETINQMAALGVFSEKTKRVCEIGPGTGRYLEKTLKACDFSHCEIYETASEWADWLIRKYKVISHPCDGKSLASTPPRSIDLVQAHKVFVYLPFLTTCHYFVEMARVVRDGGKVVFDILSDDCMDDATLDEWFASGIMYPRFMGKQFTVDFFERRGISHDGSFFIPLPRGKTECLVFTKQSS